MTFDLAVNEFSDSKGLLGLFTAEPEVTQFIELQSPLI